MEPRSLVQFARIKPLAAWSLSGAVLGTALALYLSGWNLIAPGPMVLAIVCVVLMQYVAHPMNDMTDYELDRQAPIASTGRFKPLVDGSMSMAEAKGLSTVLVLVILVLIGYLVFLQPVLVLPAAYGIAALIGYNHPSLRWAYKPFTELYLSMPINAISVLVISFIGSGQVTGFSVMVSLAFGFASSAFFVSMMSMDFPTDRANGKRTTVVSYPRSKWCTEYPLIGLAVVLVALPITMGPNGIALAASLLILSLGAFLTLAWYGSRADRLRFDFLNGGLKDLEGQTGPLRLHQLYVSVLFALLLAGCFVVAGAI